MSCFLWSKRKKSFQNVLVLEKYYGVALYHMTPSLIIFLNSTSICLLQLRIFTVQENLGLKRESETRILKPVRICIHACLPYTIEAYLFVFQL